MTPQLAFLLGEYFRLSLQGASQRAGIYVPEATEANKREVHEHLREHLERASEQYLSPVSEGQHCATIVRIADSLSRRHGGLLRERRFRIGPAQKALNLYLKYLWCSGLIGEPPHCPIDARVMTIAKLPPSHLWTQIYRIEQYKEIVAALKHKAAPLSLAVWELEVWRR